MEKDSMKTGTTTVAMICKDGLVMAADRRATIGNMIASKGAKKVVPINEDIIVTTAGSVSDIQLLVKLIGAQLKLLEVRNGKKSTVKQAANLLGGMVYQNVRKLSAVPGITGFIMGGRDRIGLHMYDIWLDGSMIEIEDFYCHGSGAPFALGVMEAGFKKNMPINDGIKLVVRALNSSLQRDSASGNGINVYTITEKEGVKEVFEREVNTIFGI